MDIFNTDFLGTEKFSKDINNFNYTINVLPK